jgi:hypothetical protein
LYQPGQSIPQELAAQVEYELGRLAANDPNPEVRMRAMSWLDDFSHTGHLPSQLVPLLIKVLRRPDTDSLAQSFAVGILKDIGPPAKAAIPVLTDLTDHGTNVDVREGAAEAVIQISFNGSFNPGPGSSELGRKLVGIWRGGRQGDAVNEMTLTQDGRFFSSSVSGEGSTSMQWMVSGSRLVFLAAVPDRFATAQSSSIKPPIKPIGALHVLTVDASVMVVEGDNPITYQRVVAR